MENALTPETALATKLIGDALLAGVLYVILKQLWAAFRAEAQAHREEFRGLITRYETLVVEQSKLFQRVIDALDREDSNGEK